MILTSPTVLNPPQGCQVSYSDWVELSQFVITNASIGTALSQGVTNALPPIQPLTVSFPVSGMTIGVGGASVANPQWALCQGLLCASVGNPPGTQVTYTVPNNTTGGNRIDAIAVQAVTQTVSTVNRPVEQPDGSKPVQAVPEVIYGLGFFYVTGPSGGGSPTIPSGYVKYATLTVPNGAVAVTDANLTVNFPYMNPNAFVVTTTSTTVPAEGSNVTINVNDTSVWGDGDFGYCVGPHSDNGFMFQIITGGVDDNANTLTVENVNTTINGSGNMPAGAYILPAGISPVVCSTTVTNVPNNIGGSFTIDVSSTGQFTQGTYGLLTGRVHGKGAYVVVTAQNSATQLQCTLVGLAQGGISLLGSTLLPGSTLNSCGAPGLIEEDQDNGGFLNPTQASRIKFGSIAFASAGSQSVSFATGASYTGASTYQIFLGANTTGMDPTWGSKGSGGFSLSAAAAGSVSWMTIGY